jgi:hypothetical protein
LAEKIVNGTFATDLSSWVQSGAYNYVWDGAAKAASSPTSNAPCYHILNQNFSVDGAVQTALLTVANLWDVMSGDSGHGAAVFTVAIKNPSGVSTTVATSTKSPGDGGEYICNALDVSSYLTTVGTYTLVLTARVRSAKNEETPPPGATYSYDPSFAWYDDISLVTMERVSKTVVEALGGGELGSRVGLALGAESIGMFESITSQEGKFLFSKIGLMEFIGAVVDSLLNESTGMTESYLTHVGRRRTIPLEAPGLKEYLLARWTVGNVTIERNVLTPASIWTDLIKAATDWETI